MAETINNVKLTNGVSYGAVIDVEDNKPFKIQFVGCSDTPVNYPMAVVCTGATFEEENGVYTITPSSMGPSKVHIIAQRSSLSKIVASKE